MSKYLVKMSKVTERAMLVGQKRGRHSLIDNISVVACLMF